MSDQANPAKNDAVISTVSADNDQTLPVTPLKISSRVPRTKRKRKFDRQVQKAKAAILSGDIEPKARQVAAHCQCAHRTALSILSVLTDDGVVRREGRGWTRAAA